ncbi:MAG: glycosyltransferase [Candidatus Micrarchaeia archaeon]
MRIGIVSDVAYPWVKGGLQATEHTEAENLAKEHEVLFFTLQFPGMKDHFFKDGIQYMCVEKAKLSDLYVNGHRSVGLAIKFARALPKALYQHKLDALYVNTMPYLHLPAVKRYGSKTGAKIIFDAIEVWDKGYWSKYIGVIKGTLAYYFVRKALAGADYYIANSSTTASKLRNMGIDSKRIRVFSPIVDLKELKAYNASNCKGDGTVVFAGRLIKEKRVDLWIDAVSKAHELNKKVKGLIIGDGPEKDLLSKAIKERNASEFIEIRGFMESKTELYRKIASSSVFLNMSEREGLSAISIESVALGTPVLLPNYTPIPKEVKKMCLVTSTALLPEKIAEIVDSRKGDFIKNADEIKSFDTGRINKVFYSLIAGKHAAKQ